MRSPYTFAAAAAVAVVGAAQAADSGTVIVYETFIDCSSTTSGMATTTGMMTETDCPHCTGGNPPMPTGPTTVYTTVYKEFCGCSDIYTDKTYTVTEECSSSGAPRPSDYVPQGFHVTTATCHVCAETPVVATLTTPAPIAPSASPAKSAPAPAAAVPTGAGSSPATPGSGSPPAGGATPAFPAGGSPAGGSPAGGAAPASPAGSPAGSSPDYPASPAGAPPAGAAPAGGMSPASPAGAGAGAGAAPGSPAGPPAKAPYSPAGAGPMGPAGMDTSMGDNSSSITPFTGSASSLSTRTSFASVVLAIMGVMVFGF
ncbi:MAG: hypothetical protein LQ341_003713 [Variospora aurantia]|nr:MAG: hypothetical protein LQ341_003713 [Variospora aurantia]